MNILILQGSPRANGNTAWMAEEYKKAAEAAGHQVTLVNVARKKINGCLACEYCHTKGNGACIQKDERIVWNEYRGKHVDDKLSLQVIFQI